MKKIISVFVVALGSIAIFSCGGAPQKMRGPASDSASVTSVAPRLESSPIVEGQIEFLGPDQKWGGPNPLLLKITARVGENAQAVFVPGALTAVKVSTEKAREKLSELEKISQGPQKDEAGCLSPIRVRLVKANGEVLDRLTCRGVSALAYVASQTTAFFLTPETAPAPILVQTPTTNTPSVSAEKVTSPVATTQTTVPESNVDRKIAAEPTQANENLQISPMKSEPKMPKDSKP